MLDLQLQSFFAKKNLKWIRKWLTIPNRLKKVLINDDKNYKISTYKPATDVKDKFNHSFKNSFISMTSKKEKTQTQNASIHEGQVLSDLSQRDIWCSKTALSDKQLYFKSAYFD